MKNKEQIFYKIKKLREDLILAKKMHYINVIKIKTNQIKTLKRLRNSNTKKIKNELLLLKDEMQSKNANVITGMASEEILKWLLQN